MVDPKIKLFPADKNYILKEAQADLKDELLEIGAYTIVNAYLKNHNSLGLEDDLTSKLNAYQFKSNFVLESLYRDMAGYYRFQNAENQLELLFDGESHYYKFSVEWRKVFLAWISDFCLNFHFQKALLGATVFYPGAQGEELLESRVRVHLSKHFNLKVYKYKGIREFSAA